MFGKEEKFDIDIDKSLLSPEFVPYPKIIPEFPYMLTQIKVIGSIENPRKAYEMQVCVPHEYSVLRLNEEDKFVFSPKYIKSFNAHTYELEEFMEKDIRKKLKTEFPNTSYKTMKTSLMDKSKEKSIYRIEFLAVPKKDDVSNIIELPLPVVFVDLKTADIMHSDIDYRIKMENREIGITRK